MSLNQARSHDTDEHVRPRIEEVALSVRGLGCERNDLALFSELDFGIKPGELWQIDGANGTGKTTLLRVLCGLLLPDEGSVYWYGQPIQKVRAEYLQQLVFLGHKDGIKDELTPVENLVMDRCLAGACSDVSPRDALEHFGIPQYWDTPCRQLSAGQRRRVGLARLLVTNAQLWVLDEPLTALDRDAQDAVRDLLLAHVDNQGMAVITTHQQLDWKGRDQKVVRLGDA